MTSLLKMQALTEVLSLTNPLSAKLLLKLVSNYIGVSIRNVGTQVAPKSIEKCIVCI